MNHNNQNRGKTIAIAANQSTGKDVLESLLASGYHVAYLINVGPEKAHMIADYCDLAGLARVKGIELLRPPTYAMNDAGSSALFEGLTIDMIITVGWQRLIPGWLLDRLSIGAFGMHGSSEPLPRGRGRSPMNWSILEDRKHFLTNLFRYDEGVDSGMIVATQQFDIFTWDTIRTLHHKNALAQVQLLLRKLPALLEGRAEFTPQDSSTEATYYPKRVPDDGVIDWHDTAERIHRLVRAVTRPYPGAFTFAGEDRVFVWQGNPFDASLKFEGSKPGEIVAAFHDQSFVVRCGDISFCVDQWEAPKDWQPRVGHVFKSQTNPSWQKLEAMKQTNP